MIHPPLLTLVAATGQYTDDDTQLLVGRRRQRPLRSVDLVDLVRRGGRRVSRTAL
jgi:hypothetical protein